MPCHRHNSRKHSRKNSRKHSHKHHSREHHSERQSVGDPTKAIYLGYGADLFTFGSLTATIQKVIDFGYNLIVLAFWIDPDKNLDPYSAAWWWNQADASARAATVSYAHTHGAKIILAVGGATYSGYQLHGPHSGQAYGTTAANQALQLGLDGLDFDMENFVSPGFTTSSGMTKSETIAWLTDATNAARAVLGVGAFISHAPQSPYFSAPEFSSGYLDFYLQTNPPVDKFFIQYYNQGATYLTYDSQFINNDNFHPGTAVAQLIARGLPKEKIVVGKLTQPSDGQAASWVPPETLSSWVQTAKNDPNVHFWDTGMSTWQFNTSGNPTSQFWINTIYPS